MTYNLATVAKLYQIFLSGSIFPEISESIN